jgi:hypothetical protein
MKSSPLVQSTLVTVSHFIRLLPLSQVQQTLSVFAEPTLDDPAIVRFQGYDMYKEGISVDEYGYASDSDLGEEDDEVDETIHNTPTTVKDLATKEAQCTISSRSILVKDTAFDTCGLLPY